MTTSKAETEPHVTWAKGGAARVIEASADVVVLVSTIPSPPGSRLEGSLAGDPPAAVKVKIHASRRQEDGSFRLEGRPLDLTREVRDRLVALAGAPPAARPRA